MTPTRCVAAMRPGPSATWRPESAATARTAGAMHRRSWSAWQSPATASRCATGFPGNTVDVTTVAQVKEDLKGWQLTRCLFVGDAGMVSQANFQALAKGGGKYLMAMPMRRGDEVTEAVLSRPGRYRKIADNLEVKEVVVGDGERRRRYAVCFNPQEARRQRAHRDERIRELEAELACLADQDEGGHSKRVCALRSSARYGRLLKETKRGLAIDRQAIAELERFDGKFVVHSNDDTLTAEDMALGYKQQQRVEELGAR